MEYIIKKVSGDQLFKTEKCEKTVYQETDKNNWIECSFRKSKISMVVGIIVLVLVFLGISYFLTSADHKKQGYIAIAVLFILMSINLFYAKSKSGKYWDFINKNIQKKMAFGLNREEAGQELQEEVENAGKLIDASKHANKATRYIKMVSDTAGMI